MQRANGFSIVELTIATAVTLAVTAAAFTIANPARGAFAAEPEAADMQQRLRVAADALYSDLVMVGAGAYSGPSAGPLAYYFPPVFPSHRDAAGDGQPGTFSTDTITLMYVPATSSQTTVSSPMSGALAVEADPNCPPGQHLCGFDPGMTVLVYGSTGNFGAFTVEGVLDAEARLLVDRAGDMAVFPAGSMVVQATSRAYTLKRDAATETYQIVRYDGSSSRAVPVVDHVVGLTFEYYGEARPPALRKPATDPVGPWTTYGPKPPPAGVQGAGGGYPPGESCLFRVDPATGQQASRLAVLGDGSNPSTPIRLTGQQLIDGPWCPDPGSQNRWDADLLRIREIGVTIRVESAVAALRGPAGVLFARGGTSRGGGGYVPDQEVRFRVSPRNLNLGR